eukprot:COSAG06_NODE_33075_length_495_cov_3.396465_1_plen_84_part_01
MTIIVSSFVSSLRHAQLFAMSKPPPPPHPATAELSQAPPPVAADIKKETKRREKLAEFWSAFLPIVTISLPWQIELRHYRLVSQ